MGTQNLAVTNPCRHTMRAHDRQPRASLLSQAFHATETCNSTIQLLACRLRTRISHQILTRLWDEVEELKNMCLHVLPIHNEVHLRTLREHYTVSSRTWASTIFPVQFGNSIADGANLVSVQQFG